MKIRISVTYGSYNQRRYGCPWISKVTSWPIGGRAELEWGAYCGDDSGGEVEILAEVGDVIRHGQKDHRGNNSVATWNIVQADGSLTECTATEARQAWESKQTETPNKLSFDLTAISDDILIAEIKRRKLAINI